MEKAKNYSGVTAPDEDAVQIKLSKPDATMLHVSLSEFLICCSKRGCTEMGQRFWPSPGRLRSVQVERMDIRTTFGYRA